MLMGDKYFVWERPGSVSYTRKVLKESESEILCNTFSAVFHQKLFWVFNIMVCTFIRGQVCGYLTQMQCGCQP